MAKKNANLSPSFEQLYTELETTIETLEAGNLSLDEALALYARGIELAKQCNAMLDQAELRIQELAPTANTLEDDSDLELLDGDQAE
ncbi:MAG: exodeoxyribonuclease VII small subunit [Chloroflexi bacterium]|nr:exodeoxyribonuclease VII small subunit [Chloroflexota bacterium]